MEIELGLSATGEAEAGSAGEQPAENSRLETHSDGSGADRNRPAPASRRLPCRHLRKRRGRSPDPSKTHLRLGAMAWGAPLRWQTRRLEVVWRPSPRAMP